MSLTTLALPLEPLLTSSFASVTFKVLLRSGFCTFAHHIADVRRPLLPGFPSPSRSFDSNQAVKPRSGGRSPPPWRFGVPIVALRVRRSSGLAPFHSSSPAFPRVTPSAWVLGFLRGRWPRSHRFRRTNPSLPRMMSRWNPSCPSSTGEGRLCGSLFRAEVVLSPFVSAGFASR